MFVKGKIDYYYFILHKNKIVKILNCAMISNEIKVNRNICKYEKTDEKDYSNIDERMMYVRNYNKILNQYFI